MCIVSVEDLILSNLDMDCSRRRRMNDTSPEIEAFLKARYAAMTGSERALIAMQMFETAQQIALSSLDSGLSENQRRRELCRRFYGEELAQAAFPAPATG